MPDLRKNTDANTGSLKTKYIYHPRLSIPTAGNKYYNTARTGGWNNAIVGNVPRGAQGEANRTGYNGLNVLPNCVGYAYGRFNEIADAGKMLYLSPVNAGNFMDYKGSCRTGKVPKLGACMVWKEDGAAGHVAIVEQINADGSIVTSESEWNGSAFKTYTRRQGDDGQWVEGCSWQAKRRPRIHFQGFIYNPAVPEEASGGSAWQDGTFVVIDPNGVGQSLLSPIGAASTSYERVEYETVTKQVEVSRARTVEYDGVLNQTKSTSLLTYPTNVESPFVLVKVGNFTFGTYNAQNIGNQLRVNYPNFIRGMEVTKINGRLNQYTIQLVYQIQHGNDPNLVDKIFSSVGYGIIKISYGDWSAPTFIYKEEEALITKLSSNVDFLNSRITYTLNCTSTALGLISSSFNFEGGTFKPSDRIKSILFDTRYGMTSIFTGMQSLTQVNSNGWIASNDKAVKIEAKEKIDPLSYINYLVSCMVCESNSGDEVLLDSSYYLSLMDDTYGEQGGPYFTIKQIYSDSKTISNQDVYEVDIGYPSDAMVVSFNLRDDQSWSLLYNYNDDIQSQDYVYDIDNDGNVITSYSPAYSTSASHFITTPSQKTWWTQMTKFPVTASLVIKGLVRPAMLMSYVKVNAFFYGKRHISSGIYFVTKQVDKINGNGYRTELSLTRFAGDEDYIRKEVEERTFQVAKVTLDGTAGAREFVGDGFSGIGNPGEPFSGNGRSDTTNNGHEGAIITDKVSREPKVKVGYSGGGRKVNNYVV